MKLKIQQQNEEERQRLEEEKKQLLERKKRLALQREVVVFHHKTIRIVARELADTIVYTRYVQDEQEPVNPIVHTDTTTTIANDDDDFVKQVSLLSTSKYNEETEELSTPITPSTPIMSVPNLKVIFTHRLMLLTRSAYFRFA